MDDWHQALRRALLRLAAARRTATYNELASLAAVPPPHRIHSLTLRLEDLIRTDHAAGRPLLAAVAVSRGQNGIPGPGFFQLLRELGRYQGPDRGAEAAACHADELRAAWDHWGGQDGEEPVEKER